MAYICEFDCCGISRKDNELFVEWLEADGRTAAEIKYVKERTCKIERVEHDEYGVYYYTSCGHCTVSHSHVPCFCSECGARVVGYGAKVVGHETRNMSDKEKTCEGRAIPNRDYGHAPSPCNFCARNDEERLDLYTPAKVVG